MEGPNEVGRELGVLAVLFLELVGGVNKNCGSASCSIIVSVCHCHLHHYLYWRHTGKSILPLGSQVSCKHLVLVGQLLNLLAWQICRQIEIS